MAERKLRIRPLVRALHRDVGYFAVGLTFVYALSGIAVNHIDDWEPNSVQIAREHPMPSPWPKTDPELAEHALQAAGLEGPPADVYRATDTLLKVVVVVDGAERTLHVNTSAGTVFEEGEVPRPIISAMNWLHLNRGKQAWTYIADGYAVFLLFLATSGLFMLPGRKGFLGRGALIATLGAAIPIAYVALSGP